ncbi:heptaprenylglyceryl phosphate synthase [Caldinitratiruptor microaerophilus]|uniref:Heptaprenylglyceryl phosphate synthase n=1 Tax=Caldinitratiruptor microaerophilus TaxID=671077 RepID=A0AA35CM58_9FIRM|nr:heptaprenylglyceryl phosphate synthase [Caldinitratiruptor microaerophilus]
MIKLDPDRALSARALELVLATGADALLVGGTQGITAEKVLGLLGRLEAALRRPPVWLEVSSPAAAVPGAPGYLVPFVLNAGDPTWTGRAQAEALGAMLPRLGAILPWERLWPAAYLILNPDSAAARLTAAEAPPPETAVGYAALAGRLLRLPLLYVEYSGRFGDTQLLDRLRRAAGPSCRVWYGGGVDSGARAAAAARAAHAVVVGNAAHEVPDRLSEIAAAVRATPPPP